MRAASPIIPALVLLFLAGCGQAPKPGDATDLLAPSSSDFVPPPALIIVVMDVEHRPIHRANVTIEDANRSTTTRFDGKAVFIGLPAGKHRVLVALVGYVSRELVATTQTTGSVEVSTQLEQAPEPLVGIVAAGGSGRCREGTLPTDTPDGICDDLSGECPNCVAPRLGGLPDDVFRLDGSIAWEGEIEAMQFQLRFLRNGSTVPTENGTLTWVLEGASPLNFTLDGGEFWNALRARGWALEVRGHRPSGTPPDEFDFAFYIEAYARHYDPTSMPTNRSLVTVFESEVEMPREGSSPFDLAFDVDSAEDVSTISIEIIRECPTTSSGEGIRLRDPAGRSIDLAFEVEDLDIVAACRTPALRGPTQIVWPVVGTWTVSPLGECTCSVSIHVEREVWTA